MHFDAQFMVQNLTEKKHSLSFRETKIRLHHLAQIDFVIKVRECTKLRHTYVDSKQKKNKNIFGTFCDEVSRRLGYL